MAMASNKLRLSHYRWRKDVVAVTADSDWLEDTNDPLSIIAGITLRLRMNVERIVPTAPLTTGFRLAVSKNGAGFDPVNDAATEILFVPSSHYDYQDDCESLLLDSSRTLIGTPNGMHMADDGGPAVTATFAFPDKSRQFETEWCIRPVAGAAVAGDVFEFKLTMDNGNNFSQTTLNIPTLTILAVEGPTDGAGNIGATVRGSGSVAAAVQGEGYLGPAVKGSGVIRPEDS